MLRLNHPAPVGVSWRWLLIGLSLGFFLGVAVASHLAGVVGVCSRCRP